MLKSRVVKPEFFVNEDLSELNPLARLLFIGLWCAADREGRLEDRPKRLKIELLPYDDCDIDQLLQSLHPKHIIRYEVDGKQYIQVVNFTKHQSIHQNEKKSSFPDIPSNYMELQGASCNSGDLPVIPPTYTYTSTSTSTLEEADDAKNASPPVTSDCAWCKKPKTDTSGVQFLFQQMHNQYRERFGTCPHIIPGKDGSLLRGLLKSSKDPDILAIYGKYLNISDPFYEKHGYSIALFAQQFDGIRMRGDTDGERKDKLTDLSDPRI